jgi:phage FluMu protein Com
MEQEEAAPVTATARAEQSQPHRMVEVRCRSCGRLLFKADACGRIETVCPDRDCKRYQTVTLPKTNDS